MAFARPPGANDLCCRSLGGFGFSEFLFFWGGSGGVRVLRWISGLGGLGLRLWDFRLGGFGGLRSTGGLVSSGLWESRSSQE